MYAHQFLVLVLSYNTVITRLYHSVTHFTANIHDILVLHDFGCFCFKMPELETISDALMLTFSFP